MGNRRKGGLGISIALGSLLAIGGVMWLAGTYVPRLDGVVEGLGPWAPVAYLAVCLVAAVLMIPGSATKLAAGALFGLAEGMVWGFTGAVLGSVAAFTVARLGRRSWLERRMRALPRLSYFDRSVADDGRRIALLVRLSPLIPFNVLNYALGFSRVRTRDFLLASFGMIPSVWLYVYSGEVARELALTAEGVAAKPWWEWTLLSIGLLATIWVTSILGRKAGAAMRHEAEVAQADEVDEAPPLDREPVRSRDPG